MNTVFWILLIGSGVIAVLFLAAVIVWIVFFKLIKGTTQNIKETVEIIKSPSKKVKERHIFYEEDGIKKECVEVMK